MLDRSQGTTFPSGSVADRQGHRSDAAKQLHVPADGDSLSWGDHVASERPSEGHSERMSPPRKRKNAASRESAVARYKADITAGALKLPESRIIADLLLRKATADKWHEAIVTKNVLQARSPATARRLSQLTRARLEAMGPDLWRLIRDGKGDVATHAALAAAVKQSRLLGDFLDLVVREQYRTFSTSLSNSLWAAYLEGCRERDPEMPHWNETTRERLRSSVFQMLAQAGYIENTRDLRLKTVIVSQQVLSYLNTHREAYVLRCIQVGP